ncbi:MAG: DUF2179 domain-containing protein [Dehalococcoidia bacterium]
MTSNLLEEIGLAAFIFALETVAVSLITLRLLLMNRGYAGRASGLGFFEALAYVVALGVVVQNITNVLNVLAYAMGFSTGIYAGIRLEHRLALGFVTIHAFSDSHGAEIASGLRNAAFGATVSHGEGSAGPVTVVVTTVRRRDAVRASRIVQAADPEAFITLEDTSGVARGWFGFPRMGSARRWRPHVPRVRRPARRWRPRFRS